MIVVSDYHEIRKGGKIMNNTLLMPDTWVGVLLVNWHPTKLLHHRWSAQI